MQMKEATLCRRRLGATKNRRDRATSSEKASSRATACWHMSHYVDSRARRDQRLSAMFPIVGKGIFCCDCRIPFPKLPMTVAAEKRDSRNSAESSLLRLYS